MTDDINPYKSANPVEEEIRTPKRVGPKRLFRKRLLFVSPIGVFSFFYIAAGIFFCYVAVFGSPFEETRSPEMAPVFLSLSILFVLVGAGGLFAVHLLMKSRWLFGFAMVFISVVALVLGTWTLQVVYIR